ncbi:MAG: response regulator [Armatimonadetes bacterium]|nr:response regulator [Armatimonadota bacterium]
MLAERVLVKAGYRVRSASSGVEALAMVEGEGLRPDGVLTDVVMPGLNGIELVRALRAGQPDLRVLFMSGYTQGHLDLGTEAPADLLVKPFGADELVARVQAMLSREPVSRA